MKNICIGERFNHWTILAQLERSPTQGKMVRCVCDCGEEADVSFRNIRDGRSKSCKPCSESAKQPFHDMIGRKFNNWTVVSMAEKRGIHYIYNTVCDCGEKGKHYGTYLRTRPPKSCHKCHIKYLFGPIRAHGKSKTGTYRVWQNMLARCNVPTSISYCNYGGRGIKVCDRWNIFVNFLSDMGERPKGLQIDRIDNDGDYEPSNCRWVTRSENCRNRRCSLKSKKHRTRQPPPTDSV